MREVSPDKEGASWLPLGAMKRKNEKYRYIAVSLKKGEERWVF
jgi:hypothetical protein